MGFSLLKQDFTQVFSDEPRIALSMVEEYINRTPIYVCEILITFLTHFCPTT